MNNTEEQFSKMLDDAIINAIQTRIALLDIKERLIEDNKCVTNTIAICIPNELVLTNVKCALPNFLLKSSLSKFLKS